MQYLAILDKWMNNSKIQDLDNKESFLQLISELSLKGIIWLTVINKKISINSKNIEVNEDLMVNNPDLLNVSSKIEVNINQVKYHVIYCTEVNNHKNILLSIDELNTDVQYILSIAVSYLSSLNRINFLENSMKMMYSDPNSLGSKNLSELNIPYNFIKSVVPAVSYSVVNENFGPNFISTWPKEFNSMANILFAVNIFSTLNSEQIARYSQLLNTTPTNTPEDGEAISVVFAIPNEDARGGVEIHGITTVISQSFVNMSRVLLIQIKSIIHSAVESIIQMNLNNKWNLYIEDASSTNVVEQTEPILKGLQIQVATLFAIQIGSDEVIKYK